jgi:hypothetical protein
MKKKEVEESKKKQEEDKENHKETENNTEEKQEVGRHSVGTACYELSCFLGMLLTGSATCRQFSVVLYVLV